MRLLSLAATLAFCATVPAAAQQLDADSIAMGAIQQLAANHGEVRDYTMVLAHGPVHVPVYVHQSGGAWQVNAPPEPALAEMMSAAVMWPALLSEVIGKTEQDETVDLSTASAGYLGTEMVGGRRAHVLFARYGGGGELPDSVGMYVDAETRQLLRLDVSGALPGSGGDVQMSLELGDYREQNGLTLPMRLRLRMQGDLGFSPKELQSMREDLPDARARAESMEGTDREQGLATLALFESLLLRGEMDMQLTVEEVRINTGAPRWMKELDQP